MKLNKIYFIWAVLVIEVLFTRCQDVGQDFDNKAYIDVSAKTINLLISDEKTATKSFTAAIAKPEDKDLTFVFEDDASLVDTYNTAYNDTAVLLSNEYYEIPEKTAVITAGSVTSTSITVNFQDIDQLSRDTVYVLPVTIAAADNIDVLTSGRTIYYVLKPAALINVVADIKENYLSVNWTNPGVCSNLSQVTMEAFIRARTFDKLISSVMGIEGTFLIRIGDSGYDPNQIQIATSNGNFPGASSDKGITDQ